MGAINIIIRKDRIDNNKFPNYKPLHYALKYGLQRVDNLSYNSKKTYGRNILIFDDSGQTKFIRKITREMFRNNIVPYKGGTTFRQVKASSFIEDPIHKNSEDSYFIQLTDAVSFIVHHFALTTFHLPKSSIKWEAERFFTEENSKKYMKQMQNLFDVKNCPDSELGYGIVVHPYK